MVMAFTDAEIVAAESGVDIGPRGMVTDRAVAYLLGLYGAAENETMGSRHHRLQRVAADVCEQAAAQLQSQHARYRPLKDRAAALRVLAASTRPTGFGRAFSQPAGDLGPADDRADPVPGGLVLPPGTNRRRELKWNPATSVWEAVSDVTTVYYGAVAQGDYIHVAAALVAGLNIAGTRVATDSYILYKSFGANVLRDDHMMALWAGIGEAPVVFVLAPAHTEWIRNWRCTVRSGPLALVVADDFVAINGTPYDIGMAVHPGLEAEVGSVALRYTLPPDVYEITDPSA